MPTQPRFTINRSLIVILPKQPALDWLMQVDDPNPLEISLEELRREPDAFLLPQDEADTIDAAEKWVYRRWQVFFEQFLRDWYEGESLWPKKRSLNMFKEWFDIQFQPMVWDMSDEDIEHEDWD